MPNNTYFSVSVPHFQGRELPPASILVGYGALIAGLALPIPLPHKLAVTDNKSTRRDSLQWYILGKSYTPKDTKEMTQAEAIYSHLVFALKYEGVNLLVFSALVRSFNDFESLREIISVEPTGQFSRRIWFLLEWIMGFPLANVADIGIKNYVPVLDEKIQYGIAGVKSPRQRVINNLPGSRDFCPLIFRTPKLEKFIASNLAAKQEKVYNSLNKKLLRRASSFLLLKDSKASFTIENENPGTNRAMRWGRAIGQAGVKSLSVAEIERLQQIIIESKRFTKFGLRTEGGFVGNRDPDTGSPIPDHLSAHPLDLQRLMDDLFKTSEMLDSSSDYDAVLNAAVISFGFVFIHPLVDGNGRLHRYLIHHVLAKNNFTSQGIIFPISAAILNRIADYQSVLESYSLPIMDHVTWSETKDHNVKITSNHSIDYYRYFDATLQAEFLYECVQDTITTLIPQEISLFQKFDVFKAYLDDKYEMPDKMVHLLVRFLEQGEGLLSQRARQQEFKKLSPLECADIENEYRLIYFEI